MADGDVVAGAFWTLLLASLILTPRALVTGSWWTMWSAAVLSSVVSVAGALSIGALTFLLTCLQLAGAVALRRAAGQHGWTVLMLAAILVWTLIVPAQVLIGGWFPWLLAFPLVTLVGTIALLANAVARSTPS